MSEPASPPEQSGEQHQQHQSESAHGTAHGATEPVEPVEAPHERVAPGLVAAVGAIIAGAVITLVVWNFGFIASVTSFVMAAGAVFLYRRAAGAPPRRGVVPLVVLIVAGVVATFFLLVGWDAAQAYDDLVAGVPEGQVAMGKSEFVRTSMFDGEVLKAYGKDMAFFFGFAVLGMWTTLKNMLGSTKA
jgi:hypothetical protein